MNLQKATSSNSIGWTRVVNPDGTTRPGYSWNPVGGCLHNCLWRMPNGKMAECYAKTIAEQKGTAYSYGFAHHYWRPHMLDEPLKEKRPSGIFLDSMSDLFGNWVPGEHIEAVLDVARRANWHVFQVLTKNAPRLLKWLDKLPPNLWVGVSSPPSFMCGKRLSPDQQQRMVRKALRVLDAVQSRKLITFLSLEPLSFDAAPLLQDAPRGYVPDWLIIGAASDGYTKYQPARAHVGRVHFFADLYGVAVYHKSNLNWSLRRRAFPRFDVVEAPPVVEQLSLFA